MSDSNPPDDKNADSDLSESGQHVAAGTLIADRYRVQELLGAGGIGSVYRALPIDGGEAVAVKLLHPHLSRNDAQKERFRREARAARSVAHPGVVAIHDFGEWKGQLYMVMELIQGRSLGSLIVEDFPFEPERIVAILSGVTEVLEAAHAAGVLHRDLKPANIMVLPPHGDSVEQVKLVDFGLVSMVETDQEFKLTPEGIAVGTPTYMSPEQCRVAPLDGRSDLYGLGVVLYKMLSRKLPFKGDNATDIMLKQMFSEPDPPSAANTFATIPWPFDDFTMHALQKSPDLRPRDAADFRAKLHEALELTRSGVSREDSPRKDALEGTRSTRADFAEIPDFTLGDMTAPLGTTAPLSVLVVEAVEDFSDRAATLLRAKGFRVAPLDAVATPDELKTTLDEAPPADALIVDLRPEALAILELLGQELDAGGTIRGMRLLVVGGDDDFGAMTKALELGILEYVPAAERNPKLIDALHRIAADVAASLP